MSIYATPKLITNNDKCYFYHTMDIPGYGHVEGEEWDLRDGVREYLGGVDFKGRRVLEIGPASGFLTFYMESQGAEVVSLDLSTGYMLDVAPSRYDYNRFVSEYQDYIRDLNNSYWLAHQAFNSKAKMVYGSVYALPLEIGTFDISAFGCVLLHLRDPLLALQNVLRLTREKVIIVEPLWRWRLRFIVNLLSRFAGPYMVFRAAYWTNEPQATWWFFSPQIIKTFCAAYGFEKSGVTYHFQKYKGQKVALYTVVGCRTQDMQTEKRLTSASPGMLRARLTLNSLPATVRAGQEIIVNATIQNTGDTLWLSASQESGGYVTFGVKLCLLNGQVLSDALGRTLIGQDVPPGKQIELQTSFRLPEKLQPGEYLLLFDMVDEQISWFETLGSPVVKHRFSVVE